MTPVHGTISSRAIRPAIDFTWRLFRYYSLNAVFVKILFQGSPIAVRYKSYGRYIIKIHDLLLYYPCNHDNDLSYKTKKKTKKNARSFHLRYRSNVLVSFERLLPPGKFVLRRFRESRAFSERVSDPIVVIEKSIISIAAVTFVTVGINGKVSGNDFPPPVLIRLKIIASTRNVRGTAKLGLE